MHSAPVLAQKPVSIIVSTRNGLHSTQACLDSIRSRTAFGNYSLIVADNGSADGFAKAINRAIAGCDPASDIILLHNDTEILQPDWIDRLQRAAYSAPNIGIVGCRLVGPDGALSHAGTYL